MLLINNSMNNFYKFNSNLNLNWKDIDNIFNSITLEFSNDVNSPKVYILNDTSNPTYWQYYPWTRTRFTRNFGRNFINESKEVINCLALLQSTAKKEDFEDLQMYNSLINHKFDYKRVQLIKSVAGVDVLPHHDNGRKYVINIGLKNSNTCTTYISESRDTKEFWTHNPKSFTMQDGEAFLINVDKFHAVKSLVDKDSNLDRYLITYMLSETL